jgi:hypothetical protein
LKFNKNLKSKLMSMEMDFLKRSARCPRLTKIEIIVLKKEH